MIRVGIADVTPLKEEEKYKYYYSLLPQWRKEKADRMARQEDKALSVGVWILFQKLRERYSLSEDVVHNFSHSGEFALCAVAEEFEKNVQVGCDIEKIGQFRPQLVNRFFCDSEKLFFSTLTEDEKGDMFYRYWVCKESFMKATGKGLAMKLDSFEILPDESGHLLLAGRPEEYQGQYHFYEYDYGEIPYKIALCTNGQKVETKLEKIVL